MTVRCLARITLDLVARRIEPEQGRRPRMPILGWVVTAAIGASLKFAMLDRRCELAQTGVKAHSDWIPSDESEQILSLA